MVVVRLDNEVVEILYNVFKLRFDRQDRGWQG
jgi:hypothetical protein